MKKIINKIANWIVMSWWLFPVIFVPITFFGGYAMLEYPLTWKETLADYIFLIFIILDIIKFVLLTKRRHTTRLITAILIAIPLGLIGMIYLGICATNAPDGYAHDLTIPKGLKYSVPLSQKYEMQKDSSWISIPAEAIVDVKDKNSYLQIWNGTQGGIYLYDFYYTSLPKGTVYLKCYEVSENDLLSSHRIYEKSRVTHNATSSFSKIVNKQKFTIYEGDWGDYYAVRVEVWHQDASTGKEEKLLEKIYRMEGWMR